MTVRYHWFTGSERAVLTVSRSHAVMDGVAFFEFMEAWARITREASGWEKGEREQNRQKEELDCPWDGFGAARDELMASTDDEYQQRKVECDSCEDSIRVCPNHFPAWNRIRHRISPSPLLFPRPRSRRFCVDF